MAGSPGQGCSEQRLSENRSGLGVTTELPPGARRLAAVPSPGVPLPPRSTAKQECPANPKPASYVLKLRFFDVCGLKGGGFLLSADLGKIVVRKRTIRQPLKKEPPVLIMQDALPLFKSFLKPVSLKQRARQLVLRCVIAFLMHLGKMSASRVAGAVRTDARHRAQVSRF